MCGVNPRAEAEAKLEGRFAARVLEPSPPAVNAGPWFADDPVNDGGRGDSRPVVSPAGTGDLTWEQIVAERPELAAWCAERWLAGPVVLDAVPADLVVTREALHRVAEAVLAPCRRAVNGKIGLRWTRGGFGTPYFGANRQLRVEGTELIAAEPAGERRLAMTSLRAIAQGLGPGWLPGEAAPDDVPLAVGAPAARFLGRWFGFAARVLETVRAECGPAHDPSRVQLWPEHFDLAVELGAEAAGQRAAYGLSPGDASHPAPYLYVAPWQAPPPGELWQAAGFAGAELSYAELRASADPLQAAVTFLRARRDALSG